MKLLVSIHVTGTIVLRIARSDGDQPQIAVQVPAALARGLEATQLADDTWQFLARRDAFGGAVRLDEMIQLTDRTSGSCDQVRTIIDLNA